LAIIRLFYDWDWVGAEKEFKRALQLNPNHALARAFYARELVVLGRTDEAIAQATQALELLPSPGVTDYPNWVFFLAHPGRTAGTGNGGTGSELRMGALPVGTGL